MFDIRLRKTSITKTYTTNLHPLSASLAFFPLPTRHLSWLLFSVKTIRFSQSLCEKIIVLLPSSKTTLHSAAVSCHCCVRSMQPSSTLFTSSFHQDQYPLVLLLSSSASPTSHDIDRDLQTYSSLLLYQYFCVYFIVRHFWTAHFVTTSLTITMSRWGLHNKFVQISLYKKLFNKSWSLSVLWVSSGCTL